MKRRFINRLGLCLLMGIGLLLGRGALAQPLGDSCANPITTMGPPPSSSLGYDMSMGYADDFNPPSGVDGPDIIFRLGAPPVANKSVRLTTAYSTGNDGTVITVYRGFTCATALAGAPVVSNSVSGGNAALVEYSTQTGQPYWVVIESGTNPGNAARSLNLYFFEQNAGGPTGDTCSNPFVVGSLPYTLSDTNLLGFADDVSNAGYTNSGADAVWQLPSLPGGTVVTADTLGSSFNAKVIILEGSCPGGTVVAQDTWGATLPNRAITTFTTVAGQSYYVVVEAADGSMGRVNLKIASGVPIPLPPINVNQPLQQLGLGTVSDGEFSPDGKYLVTAGNGGVVLWDVQTAQRIRTLSSSASDVAYSPDGKYIAYGYDRTTTILDVETGEVYDTITHANPDTFPPKGNQRLAFSPDGTLLAVCFDRQATGMLYNASTGALVGYFGQAAPADAAGAKSVAVSPDNATVVTAHIHSVPTPEPQPGSLRGYGVAWDASTGAQIRTYPGAGTPTADMNSVEINSGGTEVLTASSDGTANLYNLSTGALVRTFAGAVFQADLSPDGTKVALANGPTVDIRNATTGALMYQTISGDVEDAQFVRFNPASNRLFVLQRAVVKAQLWDFTDFVAPHTYTDYPGYTADMFASIVPSETEVWTGHASAKAFKWDVVTGGVQDSVSSLPPDAHIVGFSDTLSPGQTVFVWAPQMGGSPFTMTAVDVETEAIVKTYTIAGTLQTGGPTSNNVSISANGQRIAAGGLNRIVVWDTQTQAVVRDINNIISPVPTPPAQAPDVQLVALSDDGSKVFGYLAAGMGANIPNRARVWDATTGAQLAAWSNIVPLEGAGGYIVAADWSPDGARLVTGDSLGNACVWDPQTGQFIFRMFTGVVGNAHPVQFSDDNQHILVGADDARIHLHASAEGEVLVTMAQPDANRQSHPLNFSFANDNTRVVAGYSDGRTFVWELDPPRAVIVGAGDPDPSSNALTVQTRALAEYAAQVCNRRGYRPEEMRVLSSFVDPPFQAPIDYDGDTLDDTHASTTKANLRDSIVTWMNTSSRFGRRLFLYMTDHGLREAGETHFILNACETISATELDAMLDELQDPAQNGGVVHEVTLVIDCCYSGQFVTTCAPTGSQKRTVIASTGADELAVFLPAPDLTSFTQQFFGAAYMGASIAGSYNSGKSFFQNFSIANQIPSLVDELGATGTGTAAGFIGESWMYAGSGSGYSVLTDLGTVTLLPGGTLTPGTIVTITADVNTASQPNAVYAQVIPPAPDTIANNPVTNLPVLTLTNNPVGSDNWEATYTVTEDGTYTFGVYGAYDGARRSSTELVYATVSEVDPEESRPLVAVVVAGQEDPTAQTGEIDDQALQLTARAFLTAEARQYPTAQIRTLGPSALTALGTNVPQTATYANFIAALNSVTSGQTGARLFVSLIGPIDSVTDNFLLSPGQTISPAQLDAALTSLQTTDPTLEVVLLIDCPKAGRYEATCDKPNRFLALGTDDAGEGFFLPDPTYQSFSRRFLEASRQGRDIYDSWNAGEDFATLFGLPAPILTDGTGAAIPTGAADKYLGRRGVFASDAGELATICNVAPDQIPVNLSQAQVYVDFQEGLVPVEVTAQAIPASSDFLESDLNGPAVTVTLTRSSPTSFRWYLPPAQMANLLTSSGNWLISYEASYATSGETPRQSQAAVTRIGLTDATDIYEPSPYFDSASATTENVLSPGVPQNHTLHTNTDEDWGIVYQIADTTPLPFSLHFDLNLPTNAQLRVEIYANGPGGGITQTDTILWTETTHDTQWLGTGIKEIYFRVRLLAGDVGSYLGYRVTFNQNTGANNGIATTIGAQALEASWSTNSVPAGAEGFNVWRSDTGAAGSFSKINPASVDVPGSTGACPGQGCADYVDTGLQPLTVYFYKVDIIQSGGSTAPWTGTFYGYTNDQIATPTSNAVTTWNEYE